MFLYYRLSLKEKGVYRNLSLLSKLSKRLSLRDIASLVLDIYLLLLLLYR